MRLAYAERAYQLVQLLLSRIRQFWLPVDFELHKCHNKLLPPWLRVGAAR